MQIFADSFVRRAPADTVRVAPYTVPPSHPVTPQSAPEADEQILIDTLSRLQTDFARRRLNDLLDELRQATPRITLPAELIQKIATCAEAGKLRSLSRATKSIIGDDWAELQKPGHLCLVKDCTFYRTPRTGNMCSVCFKRRTGQSIVEDSPTGQLASGVVPEILRPLVISDSEVSHHIKILLRRDFPDWGELAEYLRNNEIFLTGTQAARVFDNLLRRGTTQVCRQHLIVVLHSFVLDQQTRWEEDDGSSQCVWGRLNIVNEGKGVDPRNFASVFETGDVTEVDFHFDDMRRYHW